MNEPALRVDDLVKTYRRRHAGEMRAVDGLSFAVRGERSSATRAERRRQDHDAEGAEHADPADVGPGGVLGFDVGRRGSRCGVASRS
jgi:hypothetical protein